MYNLLHGLRVIDLTTVVLGPYATQTLGDLGADVLKVETLEGDIWRAVRPGHSEDMGAGFINTNRNKKSIAVDLKTPEGREILQSLIRDADVLVHNMRPKSADKLGLSYEGLKELNPNLIYCFAAGFGKDGPYADAPAYDDIVQAMSGLSYINANDDGEPRFVNSIVCDKIGALHLVIAVLSGVAHRDKTGSGCAIEAPMFESMVSFLMVEQLSGRTFDPPLGGMSYDRLTSPHRKPHRTKDGFVCMLPYNSTHWTRFLELIGRSEIAQEDWVQDPVKRSLNIDRLYQIIAEVSPQRTTDEWLDALRERDIPCAPAKKLDELLDDPHLTEVGFFQEHTHPDEGRLRTARSPFVVTGAGKQEDRPTPRLGGNTRAVLQDLGYDDKTIQDLIDRRVVGTK